MSCLRGLGRCARGLLTLSIAVHFTLSMAVADSPGIRLSIGIDGTTLELEAREVPLREVIEAVFSNSKIKLEWQNLSMGNQLVSGKYRGTPIDIGRRLFASVNFAVVYTFSDGKPQIAQIMMLGKSDSMNIDSTAPKTTSAPMHASNEGIALPQELAPGVAAPLQPVPAGTVVPSLTYVPADLAKSGLAPISGPAGVIQMLPAPAQTALPLISSPERVSAPPLTPDER